jgi:HEAT repeat protein
MDDAIRSYRRAIDLDDRLFPTYLELAELHLARGEVEQADDLFRRVLRGSPDDDLVARAGHASLQIHLGASTLASLEQDVLPLALAHTRRPVYRRLAVELYDALATPLVQVAQENSARSEQARDQLRRIGTRALKPLLEALADEDPSQRQVAVDILGHLDNSNAAGPLLSAVEDDRGDATLRARALLAAGAVADEDLAPRFEALATGPERRLRGVAAWGLAHMGGRRAVASMRVLLGDGDPAVRAFAALGLGQARDTASTDRLATLLRQDRNQHVVACAAWAVGRVGRARHVPSLIAALRGGAGLVPRAAAFALGASGDDRARAALAEAVFAEEPALRSAASSALTVLARRSRDDTDSLPVPRRPSSAGGYLSWMLHSRVASAPSPADAAPHVAELARAASDTLRGPPERVVVALTVLVGPEGGLALYPWLNGREDSAGEEQEVLDALAELLRSDLVRAAEHPDAKARVLSLRILSELSGQDVSAAIVGALEAQVADGLEPDAHAVAVAEQADVQRAALAALSSRHSVSAEAVASVAGLLAGHRDWDARLAAAQALSRVGGEAAATALATALLDDDYAFVREAAAVGLGRLGGARSALEQARDGDAEPSVRRAAQRALQRGD